jgi:hypothetical protein
MASTVETSTTEKILKDKYGDIDNLVPTFGILQQRIKFSSTQKIGRKFIVAVTLQLPQGHTYNGNTSSLGNAFALNDAQAGVTEQAEAYGTEYLNRDFISYGLISKSDGGTQQAFEQGLDLVVKNLNSSSRFALEELTLYGGRWIGEVSGAGFSPADPAPATSGANNLIVYCSKREWAAGLWSVRLGSFLDVYSVTGTWPLTTAPSVKRNLTGTVRVVGVNGSTRAITLQFSVPAERASVVETDVIIPMNANGNWSNGIVQTGYVSYGGGTLYNINSSLYPMFQASAIAQTSTGTWAKITQIAAMMTARGGMRNYTVLVSPWLFNDINNEQAALRQYVEATGAFENGANSLKFNGPNGSLEILAHPMVKASEAILLDFSVWKYVGSSMPTFRLPGQPEFFLQQMQDNAGAQLRQWWDLAPFTPMPAALGIEYGFAPSGIV